MAPSVINAEPSKPLPSYGPRHAETDLSRGQLAGKEVLVVSGCFKGYAGKIKEPGLRDAVVELPSCTPPVHTVSYKDMALRLVSRM